MDAALRAIAELVERVANAPLGLTVALSSGHTIRGMLVPNLDLHPLARRAAIASVAEQLGDRDAAEDWQRRNQDLWRALDATTDDDTLTFANATISTTPGFAQLELPVVRVDGSQIVAWWLLDQPATPS